MLPIDNRSWIRCSQIIMIGVIAVILPHLLAQVIRKNQFVELGRQPETTLAFFSQ